VSLLLQGPATINMPIQSPNKSLKGRISLMGEFELFSPVQIRLTNLFIEPHSSSSGVFLNSSSLSVNLFTENDIPDILSELDCRPVLSTREKNNRWPECPTLTALLSIRTLISLKIRIEKKNHEIGNACIVALFTYCNLENLPVNFAEPLIDEDGRRLGLMRGQLTLINMPYLSQMPRGTLTEDGVRDPMVIFSEVPLPRCAIHRSVVSKSEPALPWVRIDVLGGSHYYYNNYTLEKKIFEVVVAPKVSPAKQQPIVKTSIGKTTVPHGAEVVAKASPLWDCSRCRRKNNAANTHCTGCLSAHVSPLVDANSNAKTPTLPSAATIASVPSKHAPHHRSNQSIDNVTAALANVRVAIKEDVPPRTASKSKELAHERAKSIQGWICKACTFVNESIDIDCKICQTSAMVSLA
jgi:hypothetical protein